MAIAGYVVGIVGLLAGGFGLWRVRTLEKELHRVRVAIAYKNRVKMEPRLLDLLEWARTLKPGMAQSFYKGGAVTVVVRRMKVPMQAKTKTRTVEEKAAA